MTATRKARAGQPHPHDAGDCLSSQSDKGCNAMEDPEAKRRVAAGRTVPRRERCPPRHFRGPHKQRRRACAPSAANWSCPPVRPSGQRGAKSRYAHPEWRRVPHVPGSAAPAGPVVRQADPLAPASRNQSARGAQNRNAAPSGAGRTACGTERVISPAPNHGALRGCPRRRGSRRRAAAPAQGKTFPSFNRKSVVTRWSPKPKTEMSPNSEPMQSIEFWEENGAGEAIRTPDPNLGKVVLYP